jgi:antitoxin component YwqK of YwqJK toxin-antitoxin module
MSARIYFLFCFSALAIAAFGQQPKYTVKHFVSIYDTTEFKPVIPKKDGFIRTYIPSNIQIFDIDDDNKTLIMAGVSALVCFEGQQKNGKKEGVFNIFIVDSIDHLKRYKIWEQTYSNDKLNGQWRTYTLQGTLVNFQTFKNDSLNGISRQFWIDGKTIKEEVEYFNGRNKLVQKGFYKTGKLKSEIPIEYGKITGTGKKYYENGVLMEVAEFEDGEFNGLRKYYYPNGQVWIEQIYKKGKSWSVVANYTEKGQKRDPGTLKNGNGTIIFYNEDGSVRETTNYINGVESN